MEGTWQRLLEMLRREKKKIEAEIGQLNKGSPGIPSPSETGRNFGLTEQAAATQGKNLDRVSKLSQKFLRINTRLHQIETGTFDDRCVKCSRPIGLPRLLEKPATDVCAACARAKLLAAQADTDRHAPLSPK